MKKFYYIPLSIFLCMFAAAFIIFPERYLNVCLEGFCLWAECVLPSLFPFAVIAILATQSGALKRASLPLRRVTSFFNLPPEAAACLLISLISGYPTGARTINELYSLRAITTNDAKNLSILCSTSGPMFIVGTIGVKGFSDSLIGVHILLAHILSVLAVALILSKFKSKTPTYAPTISFVSPKNLLLSVFSGAVNAMLVAGSFIVFFFVLSNFAADFSLLVPLEKLLYPLLKEDSKIFCLGLIEATGACLKLSSPLAVPICGFLVTFGGLSIILQQFAYLKEAKVSGKRFVLIKLIQALLCFFILAIFFH